MKLAIFAVVAGLVVVTIAHSIPQPQSMEGL